ncbi:MAG: nickel-responsive transcriptional regulator NikR [Pseudomonadota bacterium]|jgi:CopG family nickel-responsive transcriptional regulator
MQRVTITVDDELLAEIDRVIEERGYQNRSEAIRDLARAGMKRTPSGDADKACLGALVYVYEHPARDLAKRLTRSFHEHHDMSLATLHVHLDHDHCMEINVLKGLVGDIRQFADAVIAERGVRHGELMVVPIDVVDATHSHGSGTAHRHEHVRIKNSG